MGRVSLYLLCTHMRESDGRREGPFPSRWFALGFPFLLLTSAPTIREKHRLKVRAGGGTADSRGFWYVAGS